jgi:modulator of FtsH protease HflK
MVWDWEKLQKKQENYQRKSDDSSGGAPPNMDDIVENIKKFKIPGGPFVIIILLIVFLGYSMLFTIKADEVGVIQRFGKYIRTSQPGLNVKLPAGIEKVTKVKVKRVYKDEFGFDSRVDDRRTLFGSENQNISLMLTGDLNVAVVPWIVQYRIKDPYNYLFKVQNPQVLLRDMSEAAMRFVVGDRSINEVITKREEIANEAKEVLQKELDNAETGVSIVTIEMKKTNVPEPVQSSFNEVNQATQEKEKTIYQAKEEYNKAIPAAKGEAERIVKSAEGYAQNIINRAEGDAERFRLLYEEYKKAKDITKRRLYFEAIKEVLPKLGDKYIVDDKLQNVLPLLNLGKKKSE